MARGLANQVYTNFIRGAPTKFGRTKISEIQCDFWPTPDREYLCNGWTNRKSKSTWSTTFNRLLGEKIGELWSTNQKSYRRSCSPTWVNFFRILNFNIWVVLDPEIFTHGRHSPRLVNAHHTYGRGSPNNFIGKHLKLGLKFYIWVPITLGVVGLTSPIFTRGGGSRPGWSSGH